MRHTITLLVLTSLLSLPAYAASVWKVSKGDQHIYVGGTIHVLSQGDYPLPAQYEQAYKASDTLVFESDIIKMNDPQFQQQFMGMMFLSGGKTIKDLVSAQTFSRLEQHLTARGIPIQNFLVFKPGFLSVTLSVIELQVMGIDSAGVDQYYATKGQGDGKTTLWFESPEEQLNMIAGMGVGNEDAMINYSLDDIAKMKTAIAQMMEAWRTGNMDALADVGLLEMKADFPKIYTTLITNRNKNWLPVIEELFANDRQEFVLVGAMHLAGPESVLSMLENKGYTVSKL